MSQAADDETILSRFRDWLAEIRAEADALCDAGDCIQILSPTGELAQTQAAPLEDRGGWLQLVAEFTGLRHEVKLGTKSSRSLEEQAAKAVAGLQEAMGQFRGVEAKESAAAERAAKPLVESLADLDEALRRGESAIESARRRIVEESSRDLLDELQSLAERQSGWRRWLLRPWHAAVEEACRRQAADAHDLVFASLLEGFELIRDRLARTMKTEGVQRIAAVGRTFDPATMTAVAMVEDPNQPAGMVVDEIRPGYLWKGKVLRYAEVRAVSHARPAAGGQDPTAP